MVEGFLPRHSIFLFDLEAASNEITATIADRAIEADRLAHDVVDKLDFVFGGPWRTAVDHFVVDEPHRPQIGLVCVLHAREDLWRHVQRRSHNRSHDCALAILEVFCEAEVADLAAAVFQQNIGRL